MTPTEKAKETRKSNKAAREDALKRNKETREKVRTFCEGVIDSPSISTGEKLKACELLLTITKEL